MIKPTDAKIVLKPNTCSVKIAFSLKTSKSANRPIKKACAIKNKDKLKVIFEFDETTND